MEQGSRGTRGDRLSDPEGLWRLADGGSVRVPRQAAHGGAGRARPDRTRTNAGGTGRRAGAVPVSRTIDKDPVPTRVAYGDALVELGEHHDDVVALDADLAVSTMSIKFGRKFP